MALFVTTDDLRNTLGVGTLYSDDLLESSCQTATETLQQYLWYDSYPVIGGTVQSGVATVVLSAPVSFTATESIVITNAGTKLNGTHTITATYPWSQGSGTFPLFTYMFPYNYYTFPRNYSLIQWATNQADMNYRLIKPYGKATGADTMETAYADIDSIRNAALMLAIDVWQARQAPSSGGVSVDGITPSPYRLGNTMLAKVRGLIAPYTNPNAMIG
jgi:hypothetical protein